MAAFIIDEALAVRLESGGGKAGPTGSRTTYATEADVQDWAAAEGPD